MPWPFDSGAETRMTNQLESPPALGDRGDTDIDAIARFQPQDATITPA
jgi:hypothetical protein